MLGARARAAEYNAFKAATARQANREAEEHKLPPKPAPISLSAFTRNPQPNRNKGTKAWVPLVLEDTPEDDSPSSEDVEGTISTPTRQMVANRGNHTIHESETPLGPRNPQPIRIATSASTIPKAPRAMLAASDIPSPLANPTPQRVQPHSIIRQAQESHASSVQSSPVTFPGTSGFPYLQFTWPYSLQVVPLLGQVPLPFSHPSQPFGTMMVPSDISPTKQENKISSLAQEYGTSFRTLADSYQQFSDSPGYDGNSFMHPMGHNPYGDETPDWDLYPQIGPLAQNPFERPLLHHGISDSIIPSDWNISAAASQPMASYVRRFSYPDSGGTTLATNNLTCTRHSPANPHNDEPYDRNSKMQNFVAAQQALAKSGKTVLHNPDFHRVKAAEGTSSISTGGTTTTSEQESRSEFGEESLDPRPNIIVRPPPGFEPQVISRRGLQLNETNIPTSVNDSMLRKEFGVGTNEWFELKPTTKAQRMKMNKAMRSCANAEGPDSPKALLSDTRKSREDSLQRWMEADKKDQRGARKLVEQIAKEHLSNRLSRNFGGDGTVSSLSSGAEVESGAIRVVGEILANMTESIDSTGTRMGNGTSFCNYKPAPEYAIERGRLLTGGSGSVVSFFEETTSGFYNAPSRIARDPRFRPPSKEGMKPKSEDDWKLRHDMYGRRRL